MPTPEASALIDRANDGITVFAAVAPADPLVVVLPRFASANVDGEALVMRAPKSPWGVYVISPNADGSVGMALRGAFATIEDATEAALGVRNTEERPAAVT